MKIKLNPIEWAKMAFEKQNEYDKYLKNGVFTIVEFNKLLDKAIDINKNRPFVLQTIDKIKKLNYIFAREDYKICFQLNTGTYRLYIPTNIEASKYYWATNYICEIFDIKIQTDNDKKTYFIKNYDGLGYFQIKNLFDIPNDIDEKTWLEYNKIPDINYIDNDANYLINKVNIFIRMLDSIYNRTIEEIKINK